jgi:hypothetical protein
VVVSARLGVEGPVWVYVGAAACSLIRLLGVRFRLEAPHPPGAGAPEREE